jgi:hypothetical protein
VLRAALGTEHDHSMEHGADVDNRPIPAGASVWFTGSDAGRTFDIRTRIEYGTLPVPIQHEAIMVALLV